MSEMTTCYGERRFVFDTDRSFQDEDSAINWVTDAVNDSCVDNTRFSYLDDPVAMERYWRKENRGCCGSSDFLIKVGEKPAIVGCNFGH